MSHTMNIKTEIRDRSALESACARLGYACEYGTHQLYASQETGIGVMLPGFKYPVVFDVETGEAKYDTYGGRWGNDLEVHKLTAYYGIEKAKVEAARKGYMVQETDTEGQIELTITIGE